MERLSLLSARMRRNNTFVLLNKELSVNELRSGLVGGAGGKNCLAVCVTADIPGVFTFRSSMVLINSLNVPGCPVLAILEEHRSETKLNRAPAQMARKDGAK